MLYIFDEINLIDDDIVDNVISLLSKERLEKVQRLRTQPSKKASVIAYLMLHIALKEVYKIDEVVEFIYIGKKKPILRDYPSVHFNLSHSENVVACAVTGAEVGVDVQHITTVSEKVAKRVLTEREYNIYKSSPIPNEYFCEMWTVKEGFLKKTGQGITSELGSIEASDVKDKMIFRGKDYYCCVCGPNMQVKRIRREDIEQLYDR